MEVLVSLKGRLLLAAALSGAFTASVVHYSKRHGRLAAPPAYDDVSYFADAADRLVSLEEKRQSGSFVVENVTAPPHSPLATYLALASFLVFGLEEWAPYAANGIFVFLLLWMVDYLFRGRSLPVRGAMAILVLALPTTSLLVFEFRPDPASALMFGFGVALAFEEDLVRASTRRRCVVGALFGLAVLFKPAFFAFVLALTVATLAATIRPSRFRDALKAWVLVVAAMMAVGGLPLALRPRYYLDYLRRGLLAPPVPPHPGGWVEQALYYLTGNPEYLLRVEQLALLVAAFLASAAMLAYRQRWDRLRLLLAPLIPVAAAYLLPTLSAVKQPYFGLMFVVLLSFVVLRGLAELCGRSGAGLAFAVALMGLWFAKPPPDFGSAGSPSMRERWRIVDEVYAGVRERLDRPGMRIFVTAVGTVSPELLRFYSIRDGLPHPEVPSMESDSLEQLRTVIDWADLVIAPSPDAAEVWPYTPGARLRGDTLAAVRANASFLQFGKVEAGAGAYYLFEKIGPFYGFRNPRGLLDVEGPYPQWGLGLVRWGLGPETTLRVGGKQAGRFRLSLDGRGALPELEVALLLDDEVIARHTFQDPARFEKVEVPVELPAGKHALRIRYGQWTRNPGERPLAVLYNSLRLLPDRETGEPQS